MRDHSLHRLLNGACTCDGAEALQAVLHGKEPPLCQVHDQKAIAERNKQKKLDALARADLTAEAIQRRVTEALFPTPTPTPEQPITEVLHDVFHGNANTGTAVPLGGAEIDQALADALGLTPDQGHD